MNDWARSMLAMTILTLFGGTGGLEAQASQETQETQETQATQETQTSGDVGAGSELAFESSADVEREFQEICRSIYDSNDPYYGRAQVLGLGRYLLQEDLTDLQRIEAERALGEHLLRLGQPEEALNLLNKTLELAAQNEQPVLEQVTILSRVGLAALRLGEVVNCNENHRPGMCVLPIAPEARHADPRGSKLAIRAFQSVLSGVPEFPVVPWLLNVAAMTVGEPGAVPERYRVPPERLRSEQDIGRFSDVAGEVGLHIQDVAGGAVLDDFDGDGRFDLVTSSAEPCAGMRFFVQEESGQFGSRTASSGVASQLGALNLVHADYDGDGDLDLFVLRGGWMGEVGRVRNSLLRNDLAARGRFVDVTRAVGLAEPAYPTQTAAWADYDLDGDLDLYVGNEGPTPASGYPSQLFRNRGDGTFEDVAGAAGVENLRYAKAVAWGDVDDDGDEDLYVSNFGANRLYVNRGDGTFVDRAESLGVTEPAGQSFGAFFFDLENDGDLDLFVTTYEASPRDIADYFVSGRSTSSRPQVYRNDGPEGFREIGASMGLRQPSAPMGHNFGDLDNDGFLDVYLGTGWPQYEALMPNLMYRNDGGTRFVEVTYSGGFGHLQKGHGVAFGDFDQDGDQDVFEQMGGAYPGDAYHSVLYRNPGHGNGWIHLMLEGTRSHRSALGARVEVRVESAAGQRSLHRVAGGNGSFGRSPMRLEIGLGDAERVVYVEIGWPAPGLPADRVQRFEGLRPGCVYRLVEGGAAERVRCSDSGR